MSLIDSNGKAIKPYAVSMKSGTYQIIYGNFSDNLGKGDITFIEWNAFTEKATGTITYSNMPKGTYYIRVSDTEGYDTGAGKYSITPTFPSSSSSSSSKTGKISNLSMTLNKGSSIKLGADIKPADANIKWSSSNTSVAAVSDSGKVTAKKAGTAIITAKSGSSSVKMKVIVE